MDYLTQQFVAGLHKLAKASAMIKSELTEINKQIRALGSHAQANQHKKAPTPVVIAELHTPPSEVKERHAGEQGKKTRDYMRLAIESATLAAVVVYAYFAYDQSKSMQKTVTIANDTLQEMKGEQRPWVTVKTAGFLPPQANQPVRLRVVFINSGHQPALNTQILAKTYFTNDPNDDLPPLGTGNRVPAIMTPNMETSLTLPFTHGSPSLEWMKESNARFYIYGQGSYEDTTPNHCVHDLEFCNYLVYGSDAMSSCVGKRYTNKLTDERCNDQK